MPYLPNKDSKVVVEGIDSLLWALVEAEFTAVTELSKIQFDELRYQVSRILRRLVENFLDPEDDD